MNEQIEGGYTMTTEAKVNRLVKNAERKCAWAEEGLEGAREALERAKELSNILTEYLLEIDWYKFEKQEENEWYLETYGLGEKEADKLILQLKLEGIYGLKSTFRRTNTWYYTGSLRIGDDVFTIMVDGGSTPPACRIEETNEFKEVITYKAICEETGEEV